MADKLTIEEVLSELYDADPALKKREPELRTALTKLLASKPAVARDDKFYAELRARLLKEFGSVPAAAPASFMSWLSRPLIAAPVAAFALLLLAIVVARPIDTEKTAGLALGEGGGLRVTRLASGSFGSLTSTTGQNTVSARPQGGGGGGGGMGSDALKMAAPAPANGTLEEGSADRMMMPVEDPTYYAYVYDGTLDLADAELPVLRRIKGGRTAPFADSLGGVMPDVFDFSAIDGLNIQSFAAFQDKPYGLSVYADMNEETISVSQYYPRWPHPEQTCRDSDCYEALRLRESDMPSDADAISLADAFLDELGIDRDGYGAPEVRSDWRRWFASMTVKEDFWFPDSVSVVYPMFVDDQLVVDEGGYGAGIGVNINVREMRADSVWNLQSRNYESADYEAVTDPSELLAVARRGGTWGYLPEDAKTVIEIRLGEPERVMMRTWQYPGDGSSRELLAPGLRFPVEDPERLTRGTPEYITVPLIKEFYSTQPGYGGPIMLRSDASEVSTPTSMTEPAPEPTPNPAQ